MYLFLNFIEGRVKVIRYGYRLNNLHKTNRIFTNILEVLEEIISKMLREIGQTPSICFLLHVKSWAEIQKHLDKKGLALSCSAYILMCTVSCMLVWFIQHCGNHFTNYLKCMPLQHIFSESHPLPSLLWFDILALR